MPYPAGSSALGRTHVGDMHVIRPDLADLRMLAEPDEAGMQSAVVSRPQRPNTGHLPGARRQTRSQSPNAALFRAHSGSADADGLSGV